jgi:basic membrane protein A
MKRFSNFLAIFAVMVMVLTACGPTATEVPPTASAFRVGFVTDTAGIADKSFNQTQWEGIERAVTDLGIEAQYAQSAAASDYTPNLTTFATEGYDMIIASGFFLANDVALVATQYPNIKFVMTDDAYPDPSNVAEGNPGYDACIPNVLGEIYQTDQAAYLAGYLAAGMTTTGKIGYFGGAKIPTVTIFAVGMQKGIEAYNAAHGTNVKLLGWDNATGEGTFTNNFSDMTVAQQAATSLFDEGADIVAGVGGMIGSVVFPLAQERHGLGLWVDVDGTVLFPEYKSVILTSIMKNMGNIHELVIKNAMEGTFEGCSTYIGGLANNGVQLGTFGDGITIPAALLAEVDALKAQFIAGTLTDAGCISYPENCPVGLYPAP